MTNIILYTSEHCPKCNRLKTFLESQNLQFTKIDIGTPAGLTELRFAGCFALEAPVLQVDENFLESRSIFKGNEIQPEKILSALKN